MVGHVVHNLRPRAEALADRDAVVGLAGRLGLVCEVSEVSVPSTGNAERHARELRYGALVAIAKARGLRFIATAHHADDQLETLLMALARGAGVRGLGGMAAMRRLDTGVALVRPMLHPIASVTRAEAEGLCARAGVPWQVDATNTDTSRLRAAIRMEVVPRLAAIRPGVRTRAVMTCQQLQGAERVIQAQARGVVAAAEPSEGGLVWSRAMLRSLEPIVLGAVLRLGYHKLLGAGGMDAISASVLEACTSAIRDGSTEPRELTMGHAVVWVRARAISLRKKS